MRTEKSLFRYVFFLPAEDYFQVPYYELHDLKNVEVIDAFLDSDSKILRFLYTLHYSSKINNIINLPGKMLWYPMFYQSKIKDTRLCFIFYDAQLRKLNLKYKEYLDKKYPGNKKIVFLTDQIRTFKQINIGALKEFADLILTYELKDALQYGLEYYPDVYSRLPEEMIGKKLHNKDLIFCGFPKDREELILKLYNVSLINGVKADFIVPELKNVPKDNKIILKRVAYIDYLKRMIQTNCILEIEQSEATGYTLRTLEAITYGKKLLTNNENIICAPFYDERFIKIFKKVEDIDWNWIKEDEIVSYNISDEYMPHSFINFLRNRIEEMGR